MKKLTVALISGGISVEREVSIKSGDQVYDALDKAKYDIIRYDPASQLLRLVSDSSNIDFALIILHGPCGEDGTIQGLLDLLDIPYQGSGVLGSAVAMNKFASKQLYEQSGIPVPPYLIINKGDPVEYKTCEKRLGTQLVVKPVSGGSSIGVSIVKSDESFNDAVKDALSCDDIVLVETCVEGVELTGGVIGNDEPDALPIVEIIPDKNYKFFDYTAKYKNGATKEICPARIDDKLTVKAQTYAKMAHKALFCKGYSRTDMILSGKEIYVLETNTIPGMTANSLLPLAAKAAGISFTILLDKLIELGLEEHRKTKDRKAGK
ncbi:MAG: D-alanine--D-alanine ligase [Desulfobacterium sp.]|nr:D-alanine--D-alanine ligase [Desulfobacterium sp.]MBU3947530.1 D-alanine--D-alanine ligase [Pseudomonadota bacterium]MBU4035888.1 D-alanine--D-alanine ligase [Pseudomonadota bacterium]